MHVFIQLQEALHPGLGRSGSEACSRNTCETGIHPVWDASSLPHTHLHALHTYGQFIALLDLTGQFALARH